jgi:hypothetical protein
MEELMIEGRVKFVNASKQFGGGEGNPVGQRAVECL